jgi:hypothetical protein
MEIQDMINPRRRPRLTLLFACLYILSAGGARLVAEELSFRVGAAALGPGEKAKLAGETRNTFCARLDARDGIHAAADPFPEWNRPPENTDSETWLSFILVEIRANLDLVTLRWANDGSVSFAARRPAVERAYAGVFPYSIPPGPQQIPRNAAIELAAQTGLFLSSGGRTVTNRPLLRIALEMPESKETATKGLAMNGQEEGSAGLFAKLDDRTAEAVSALTLAAAWEAGWQPSLSEKDDGDRVTLTLAGRTQAIDFQYRAIVNRVETQQVLHRVPEGEIYPYLLRLFRKLKVWGPRVREFAKVIQPRHRMNPLPPAHAEGYEVLGWKDGILAVLTKGEKPKLNGLDAATGQPKWTVTEEGKYASLTDGDSHTILSRTGRKLALSRVAFADGTMEEILKEGGADRFAVDLETDDAVFAEGRNIIAYIGGVKAWEAKARMPIRMDLLLSKNRVAVGSDDQTVRCFARASGELQWKQSIEGRPNTGAVLSGDVLLVGTREGGLYALTGADGTVRWKRDLDDGLIQSPSLAGNRILIVDGSGSVKLLDPATGKTVAEERVTGRLIGATPAGGTPDSVAVAERTGRVTLLAIPSLEIISEVALQARLQQPPLAARDVPTAWSATTPDELEAGILSDSIKAAFLVVDEEGFVYVLPSLRHGSSLPATGE